MRKALEGEKKLLLRRRRRIIARRMLWFLRLFLIGLFFAGTLWGLNYFYDSNYFKVKVINIRGNNYYQVDEIKEYLGDISGLNIFEVNKKKVEKELTDNLVWLKDAELNKIFPDKITIEVTERKPFIIITHKNSFYLMDNEGVILEEVERVELKKYSELILVKNVIDYDVQAGEKVAVKNVLSCGRIFITLDKEMKENIKEAYIEDNISGDIVFITVDNKKIIFGSGDNITKKIETLRQILKQIEKKDLKFSIIDLRYAENPVIR